MSRTKAKPSGIAALLRAEIQAAVRLAVVLGLVGALGPFCLIVLKIQIFRLVIPTGSTSTAAGLVAGCAVAVAAVVALSHLHRIALLIIGERLARRLAMPAVLAAAERGGEPAAAAALAMRDVEEVRRGVTGPLCGGLLDAMLVPMLLLLLGFFHWGFVVFGVVCCALALLMSIMAERLTRGALVEANDASALTAGLVADAMRCAEAVEAMGMLPHLVRRWVGALRRGTVHLRRAQTGARAAGVALSAFYFVASGGAMIIGAWIIAEGNDIGVGLVVAALLTARLMQPFARFGNSLEEAAEARAAWRRLDAMLRAASGEASREARSYPCPEGRLVVDRVTAPFPGTQRAILREASLVVGPGDVVAITGPPGCGKSTLLRIILGMQRPAAGGVFLDGHSTAHWDREDLARHVGYLPQDPVLTEGTVAEAIARLAPQPDMLAVLRAARLAGAERMIAALPQGFATPVGGDFRLSTGQRQRIALARAVYGNPRIVLLDEPGAFLDEEGEKALERMIRILAARGVGILLTSHRSAVTRAAGRVVTLRSGALVLLGAEQRLLPGRAVPPSKVAA